MRKYKMKKNFYRLVSHLSCGGLHRSCRRKYNEICEKINLLNGCVVSNAAKPKPKFCQYSGVLFNFQGGLGDIILGLNYVIQVKKKFGKGLMFYATVPNVFEKSAVVLFESVDGVKLIPSATVSNGDWLAKVDLCRIPCVMYVNRDKMEQSSKSFSRWIKTICEFNGRFPDFLKHGTVNDFLLTKFTQMNGRNRLTQADIDNLVDVKTVYKLSVDPKNILLKEYGLVENSYITLQCGVGFYSGDRPVHQVRAPAHYAHHRCFEPQSDRTELLGKRALPHAHRPGAEERIVRIRLFYKTCFSGPVPLYHPAAGEKMVMVAACRNQRRAVLHVSVYKVVL